MKIINKPMLTDYQIKQLENIIIQQGMTEQTLLNIKELYPRDYEKLVEAVITLCQFGILKIKFIG